MVMSCQFCLDLCEKLNKFHNEKKNLLTSSSFKPVSIWTLQIHIILKQFRNLKISVSPPFVIYPYIFASYFPFTGEPIFSMDHTLPPTLDPKPVFYPIPLQSCKIADVMTVFKHIRFEHKERHMKDVFLIVLIL